MTNKPTLFEAACLLSIAGGLLGFISLLSASIFFETAVGYIVKFSNIRAADKLSPMYLALIAGIHLMSFSGALLLYRLRKAGLYLYLAAQVMLMFVPVFWLGSNAFSVTNSIFVILFSGVYLWNSSILKAK